MFKRILVIVCILVSGWGMAFGQHFDRLHDLSKERESIKSLYDKLSREYKTSKSKKPSPDIQVALDNLMAKDAEIIEEIGRTETAVNKAIETAGQKERIKTVIRGDKSQNVIIDSLTEVVIEMKAQQESLIAGNKSNASIQTSLENDLKYVAEEKAAIQKELDSVKTDKFILARRNWILLYFNLGIAVLLTLGLAYMIVSVFRKRRKTKGVSMQEEYIPKPRPITGFNQQIAKVAFDAFDNKLEKIEMLGKLREKGLITEEEFIMQKQQLLNLKNKE